MPSNVENRPALPARSEFKTEQKGEFRESLKSTEHLLSQHSSVFHNEPASVSRLLDPLEDGPLPIISSGLLIAAFIQCRSRVMLGELVVHTSRPHSFATEKEKLLQSSKSSTCRDESFYLKKVMHCA